jgi:hypothetical protein
MVLWSVDESLFRIIVSRLLGARGASRTKRHLYRLKVWSELGYFWMTGTRTVLSCLDTGIFTAEMCAIHFAFDLIESEPMGVYIILTDSLASIEGLKSTGISYRTNDMLFRTRKSLRYLGELGYDISLM